MKTGFFMRHHKLAITNFMQQVFLAALENTLPKLAVHPQLLRLIYISTNQPLLLRTRPLYDVLEERSPTFAITPGHTIRN